MTRRPRPWPRRRGPGTRADVFVTIEKVLDTGLPPKFEKEVYTVKYQSVFDHVYDSYLGEGKSVYGMAS